VGVDAYRFTIGDALSHQALRRNCQPQPFIIWETPL